MYNRSLSGQTNDGDAPVLDGAQRNSALGEKSSSMLTLDDVLASYDWTLNPFPTVEDCIKHLHRELARLETPAESARSSDVCINVFLLACAILNSMDEHIRGRALRLPRRLAKSPIGKIGRMLEKPTDAVRSAYLGNLRGVRCELAESLNAFLKTSILCKQSSSPHSLLARLAAVVELPMPTRLLRQQVAVPSPFRRLDLSHFDVIALAHRFIENCPDRTRSVLLVGLRTSGSYFSPLLRAVLEVEGYVVNVMTLQPDKGAGHFERAQLFAATISESMAVLVDDPPMTAGTLMLGLDLARKAGFTGERVKALVPIFGAMPEGLKNIPDDVMITLDPGSWYKQTYLQSEDIKSVICSFFRTRSVEDVTVVDTEHAGEINCNLERLGNGRRGARLKRVFEVHLRNTDGTNEIRYVLAKSVGWGWLSYHALIVGRRLSDFVPRIFGLDRGFLFMEWLPQAESPTISSVDEPQVDTAGSYIAARAKSLRITDPLLGDGQERHQNGVQLLADALSRCWGGPVAGALAKPHIQSILRSQACPVPTLIDGSMGHREWIAGLDGPVKVDFEHHGLGKGTINVADPAYDLADFILGHELAPEEERNLVRRYVDKSGDDDIERRLFINKLMAGLWSMDVAASRIISGRAAKERDEDGAHRAFLSAWHFLIIHTARYCGSLCVRPAPAVLNGPLISLDIDGVLDRRLLGFPSTSAAGISALSLLHSQGFPFVFNTARSLPEVREYCDAYGASGGVAEHGSYIWDAAAQAGRVMIGPEAIDQLGVLRSRLRELPGVFIDDRHQYSIRTFSYHVPPSGLLAQLSHSAHSFRVGDGAVGPLSSSVLQNLITNLGLDQLSFHHTGIDTTIVSKEVNKGSGLLAIRDMIFGADVETVAVGDSLHDLSMFRVATRCFAPGNISCSREANLLNCKVVPHYYQNGFLEIVQSLCTLYRSSDSKIFREFVKRDAKGDIFLRAIEAADKSWEKNIMYSVFKPTSYRWLFR